MKELELKEIKRTISELNAKFDELSKSIGKTAGERQKCEGKIRKNPLAYTAGAFVGGVIVGHLLGRGKCCQQT
ncbi:Uncharacterised protein [uncultured archaeon]|nr:Uncharacterised protein [uncultured archaeon]